MIDGRARTPVIDGVLFSRHGLVHRNRGRMTECGHHLPDRRVSVSDLQALVHKLTVCKQCYPPVTSPKRAVSR